MVKNKRTRKTTGLKHLVLLQLWPISFRWCWGWGWIRYR